MATTVTANPAATVTATPTTGVDVAANTATSQGVAATPDTIQTAQTAPEAAESKGFCAQIGGFFKGIADGIASFFASIFSKIKSLFVKAEATAETPANTAANATTTPDATATATNTATATVTATPLEALRTAVGSGLGRDEVVAAFALLDAAVQDNVKGTMWMLAGQDIDPMNAQPHDRANADDWAGRVIRNEVQVTGEVAPRADIQHYANITDANSLFRRAMDVVIAAAATPTTI
ncbi:MAG: hypothetical protein JSR39_01630 [Verrucomicrobia bacterium]|nr:hypothetical protein [Verrucomicrobiota bacterium]